MDLHTVSSRGHTATHESYGMSVDAKTGVAGRLHTSHSYIRTPALDHEG